MSSDDTKVCFLYRDFEFEVLRTEHFDIYLNPEEQEAAGQAVRMAERWYSRLSQIFEHALQERQPIVLYASHPDFEQTNTSRKRSARAQAV